MFEPEKLTCPDARRWYSDLEAAALLSGEPVMDLSPTWDHIRSRLAAGDSVREIRAELIELGWDWADNLGWSPSNPLRVRWAKFVSAMIDLAAAEATACPV